MAQASRQSICTQEIAMRPPNQKEEAVKKKAAQLLEHDRIRLLMLHPFLGALIMRLNLIATWDSRCSTAGTDGTNIFVHAGYYTELDLDNRIGVLAHCVWHIALCHFLRRGGRNKERFDLACDCEVDFLLKEEKINSPFALTNNPEWQGLNAESIYEYIPVPIFLNLPKKGGGKHIPSRYFPIACSGSGDSDSDANADDNDSSDSDAGSGNHDRDENADANESSNGKQKSGNDRNEDGGNSDKRDHNADSDTNNNGKSEWKNQRDLHWEPKQEGQFADGNTDPVTDPNFQIEFLPNLAEHCREMVLDTAVWVERLQGKLPAHLQRLVEVYRTSQLNWREQLLQFVTSCFGGGRRWLPPNRRYISQGLYLQSYRDQKLKAVIALDSSGSTTRYLSDFLAELNAIMTSFGNYELTVIQCDAEIHSVEKFTPDNPLEPGKMQLEGGGGTDFRPVFEYIDTELPDIEILLFLTDGYEAIPERQPPYPVIWCLCEGGRKPAQWGYELKIK